MADPRKRTRDVYDLDIDELPAQDQQTRPFDYSDLDDLESSQSLDPHPSFDIMGPNRPQLFKPLKRTHHTETYKSQHSTNLEMDDLAYPNTTHSPTYLPLEAMVIDDVQVYEKTASSTIQHIYAENSKTAAARHSSKPLVNPTSSNTTTDFTTVPTTGGYMECICPATGELLYFPNVIKAKSARPLDTICESTGFSLLSKPIWKLREEISRDHKIRLETLEREANEAREAPRSKKKRRTEQHNHDLWVEKYKPRGFLDLLSDQRVNREVLSWVKQWDFCVFKRLPPQETQRDKLIKKYKTTFGKTPHFENNKVEKKDPWMRPDKMILLISGPAGFGKTTLAHIIAKHAGYNTIEVNASDDRTGDVVRSKIKSALEMQAIVRNKTSANSEKPMEQKPNLLIIDEIDGASSSGGGNSESFIKQLVQLVTQDSTRKASGQNKETKKKATPLLRPILCICNDPYAPVLRPLREIAQHIVFPKLPSLTIARRLQEICDAEDLQADLRTLCMLTDMTHGDIRSCINTLQFIRGKSHSFTREMIGKSGLGQKDMSKSLFSVWDELFTAPSGSRAMHKENNGTNNHYNDVIESILNSGEYDKLVQGKQCQNEIKQCRHLVDLYIYSYQGCFEAYPKMKFNDVAMKKCVQMSEWLGFYDSISQCVNEQHEYGMYRYYPYTIVNFHRFFAGSTLQDHRIEYPRKEYEAFVTKKSYENLFGLFMEGIQLNHRRFISRNTLIMHLVPQLLRIVSPELRPVNKQVIRPAEKLILTRVTNLMVEFGLTFILDKTEEGHLIYKLDPPIEQILNYESLSLKSVLPNTYAVRQLIAQEVETELLRRRTKTVDRLENGPMLRAQRRTLSDSEKEGRAIAEKGDYNASFGTPTDFFGRPIVSKVEDGVGQAMQIDKPKLVTVAYRFHEGFSNAVKKPMTVRMFL
ncbi:hypothetical protein BDF14DRAFT_1997167 [Spinellus fusiger]|nr:hypothetical protein BDF14DRAFT_1997167 [Spinellus fusiger]